LHVAQLYSFNVSGIWFDFVVTASCFAGFEGLTALAKDATLGYDAVSLNNQKPMF
jgi:hypothetical protein